jgi:hypothetical protein
MKFIINLDKKVVNGFVDTKLVAYKVALKNCPASLDTLAIRAASDAEGTVEIDNIQIFRV